MAGDGNVYICESGGATLRAWNPASWTSTLVAGTYTAMVLEVNTEEDSLFDDEVPHRVVEIEYWKVFPNLYENIVILVDADTAELARDGAAALAERLEASPDLFSGVYLPQSEFFEEHALLYMDAEELEPAGDGAYFPVRAPVSAVVDTMEALMDADSVDFKRLHTTVDSGFVHVSGTYTGESVRRLRDEFCGQHDLLAVRIARAAR